MSPKENDWDKTYTNEESGAPPTRENTGDDWGGSPPGEGGLGLGVPHKQSGLGLDISHGSRQVDWRLYQKLRQTPPFEGGRDPEGLLRECSGVEMHGLKASAGYLIVNF